MTKQVSNMNYGEHKPLDAAYYAFVAHKNKVLIARTAPEMRIALENLDERMQEFFGDVDEPKRRVLYMEIISSLNEGHKCKDAVYDYLNTWESKVDDHRAE